jgi:hypothetical protein
LHAALVDRPCSSIRRLAGSRAREVQFHRFLRNPKVTVAEMAQAAGLATGQRVAGRDIAVIQDTSEIFIGGSEAGRAGFGPIGKGGASRGVLLHAAIAVDGQGALLGLVDEQVWTREGGKPVTGRRRPFAEKESHRWLKSCEAAALRLSGARSITMVADAESDIYELFARLPEGLHILVRAAHDRRIADGGLLGEAVAKLPAGGVIERLLPAAPGRRARTARLSLRFSAIALKAPRDLPKKTTPQTLVLSVLDVSEEKPPEGAKPVSWLLLTSHTIADARRAGEIADLYRGRFLIEQLFRTLKTAGFDIEDAEIGDPRAMAAFTGLATIAAVSIMQLVKARDGKSGQALLDCFEEADKPVLKALSRKLEGKTLKQKNPHPPDDLAFASWVIARLGGWTGYYGKPGPQVMRYGLDRYHAIKLGAEIA